MIRLRREQVDAFFDDGFVVVADVFSEREVAEMSAAFDRLREFSATLEATAEHHGSQFVVERREDSPEVRIHRVVWCGGFEPVLSRYGRDSRLVGMAARLLGSNEMSQLINQAHFKLPGDGVEFPWHQDSSRRRYGQDQWTDRNGRGSYVQTVTAIDEVRDDNGPLRFLPGSCRLGHVARRDEDPLPPGLDAEKAVTPRLAPGSVLLFGPYTFHSSLPNRSTTSRRVFINGFAFPGANSRVYPGAGAGRPIRV